MNQLPAHNAAMERPTKVRFLFNDPVFHTFLTNAPLMCVVEAERRYCDVKKRNVIIGIRCYWFNERNERCSDLFETNVLRHPTPSECVDRKLPWNSRWAIAA